ncbi:MAG: HAMP domain-containing histidine kinase [Chitinophagales bacterium]|jgi:signal transduction histidine kinase|nr:HAMP domain-containing histidine kinase [Chitinophagales bacterium]
MDIYEQKWQWKFGLLIAALLITSASLLYTNILARQLAKEERRKMQVWANALKQMSKTLTSDVMGDDSFWLDIIKDNETIPVIVTDEKGDITSVRNVDKNKQDNNPRAWIQSNKDKLIGILEDMKGQHEPIVIDITVLDTTQLTTETIPTVVAKQFIYYGDSSLLVQIKAYPYIQLVITAIFLLVAYLLFSTARRAEQNKVWLGMAKETAHQLGTPLSSLMGWVEMLKTVQDPDGMNDMIAQEVGKDVERLQLIADRFSKIGSIPKLQNSDVVDEVRQTLYYVKRRASSRVSFHFDETTPPITIALSPVLFDWVIENLLKNALDAMDGKGEIRVAIAEDANDVVIDVTDTGKGIPKSRFITVFEPGYSTKKRGWGLGLSLSKRIIETYHKGKIFVAHSSPNEGATFRVILPNKKVAETT